VNPYPSKNEQIVMALNASPLDRIRLMKALFLVWYRSGADKNWSFNFEPYLYGPCAFDLYSTLEEMERCGLIVQAPHPIDKWGNYFLTQAGKTEASRLSSEHHWQEQISKAARWAAAQSFRSLLDEVYAEAPEYASRSVFRSGARTP